MMQALNETHHDFGLPRTISAILAESCAKWCDSNAVTQCGVSLTYGQLYERADRIARFLQHELGLQPGAVVAICGDKSIDYIVGTAGITCFRIINGCVVCIHIRVIYDMSVLLL